MNFLRYRHPFGLVVTRPMPNAPSDMNDLRNSIRELKGGLKSRRHRGGDMSPVALFRDLDAALKSGSVSEWQYDLNFHMLWCYHLLGLENALHLTPQAAFPRFLPGDKSARVDMLCWMPAQEKFQLVVECDGYQYHQDRKAFERDRQRSRAFQRKGCKVLQYSGGEIWRDPIRTSSDLYEHLVEGERELEKKSTVHAKHARGKTR